MRGMQCGERTYPVGNRATHAGDQDNAATLAKADHLLGRRLGRHEHTRDVDLEHSVGILGRVLEGRRLLLDARGRYEAVQAALGVGDLLDDVVEQLRVTHVDPTVVQRSAQLLSSTLLDAVEVGGLRNQRLANNTLRDNVGGREIDMYRFLQTVECVDLGARLQQSLRLRQTEAPRGTRDQDDLVREGELGQPSLGAHGGLVVGGLGGLDVSRLDRDRRRHCMGVVSYTRAREEMRRGKRFEI